ncbi:hypothetical protein [Nocardia xishanensis]|uniref:hypothetical protein n=1 Tax=Nocardia xishanensis TaxID=238964 RepID=UPI0008321A78|nr:hypothetical protein [Nocardia xishanensis]
MTVAELIARLSEFPAELSVQIEFENPLEDGGCILENLTVTGVKLEQSKFPWRGHTVTIF